MNEEKALVLRMLEEGNITADEAMRLLDALKDEDYSAYERDTEDKVNFFSFKENIFNKISDDLDVDLQNIDHSENDYRFSRYKYFESLEYSYHILDTDSFKFHITGLNGPIKIETSESSMVTLNIKAMANFELNQKEVPYFSQEIRDNSFIFKPIDQHNLSLSIELYIPDKDFNRVDIRNSNGALKLKGVTAPNIDIITRNGDIEISRIKSQRIIGETKNGHVDMTDSESNIAALLTRNGNITARDNLINTLKIKSVNGNIQSLSNKSSYEILHNTHGSIKARIDRKPRKFDISTKVGYISLDLPNLLMEEKRSPAGSSIKARTENAATTENILIATISTGPIDIGLESDNG